MSLQEKYSDLLDSIYESALSKGGLEKLVAELMCTFGSAAGGFTVQDKFSQSFKALYTHGFESGELVPYEEYYGKLNPLFTKENFIPPNVVVTEAYLDAFHKQENFFYKTEFYNDFAKLTNRDCVLGVTLALNGNSHLKFSALRSMDAGQYSNDEIELLARLSPHLLRAVKNRELFVSASVQKKLLLSSLDQMCIGLVLLDCNGMVIELNCTANNLLNDNDGLEIKRRKLFSDHPETCQLIEKTISAGNRSQQIRINDWIHIPRPSLKPPYYLLVAHNNNRPLSFFSETNVATMLVLIDPARKKHIPRDMLQAHLNLTDRETDVAQLLIQGMPAKRIASKLDLSYESARWYVKKICAKSNCKSQSEFISRVLSELSLNVLTMS